MKNIVLPKNTLYSLVCFLFYILGFDYEVKYTQSFSFRALQLSI